MIMLRLLSLTLIQIYHSLFKCKKAEGLQGDTVLLQYILIDF